MKPEQWQLVRELYHSALEHEGSDRLEYLREACAGDAELLHEVESLLAYEKPAEKFLEAPAMEMAAKAPRPGSSPRSAGTYTRAARVSLSDSGEAGRGRDGGGLQGRGY